MSELAERSFDDIAGQEVAEASWPEFARPAIEANDICDALDEVFELQGDMWDIYGGVESPWVMASDRLRAALEIERDLKIKVNVGDVKTDPKTELRVYRVEIITCEGDEAPHGAYGEHIGGVDLLAPIVNASGKMTARMVDPTVQGRNSSRVRYSHELETLEGQGRAWLFMAALNDYIETASQQR